MSDTKASMPTSTAPDTKSKKKRKNKKKGASQSPQNAPDTAADVQEDQKPETAPDQDEIEVEAEESEHEPEESDATQRVGTSTETSVDDEAMTSVTNGVKTASISEEVPDDPTVRFDALVKDRDALTAEVRQLRQSLEELQSRHNAEIEEVQKELQDTQGEKEHAEEQYQNLLGKVNTIRSQLGERLKADAEDLAQARTRIEELEEQKADLQEQYTARSSEVEDLTTRTREQENELANLRNRSTLSQQNWLKEREELIESEAYIREEFENAKQAMHDWEVLAMEERSKCRDRTDYAADLEEQLANLRSDYERAMGDRETQSSTVDGLQKALQEIQEARRKELREIVESSQSELQTLRKQLEDLQTENEKYKTDLETAQKELERALPFEKEVKEKNLLIGKLRHEAVILNDHLTKALRFLKKGKPEDNVDRQIVTNHFLHFLALDRSDPKKFQILQLIAALLSWTDEQKEQAGLSRRGTSNSTLNTNNTSGSLRLPSSPSLFHRTPSTPSLASGAAAADFFNSPDLKSPGSATENKESLAELWQNFLEQEASSNSSHGVNHNSSAAVAGAAGQATRKDKITRTDTGGSTTG